MRELMEVADLELNQVQVIVRGMYAVAKSDGVHSSEMVMIKEFYDSCRAQVQGLTEFKELVSQDFDAQEAKDILDTAELRNTFMTSCLFLAFADGYYSEPERTIIADFAAALDISHEQLSTLEDLVKDYLIMQISGISNIDALREIAASMEGPAK